MTDRQIRKFNQILIKITGFSIHSHKNTMTALVKDDMHDYTISKMKLIVNGTKQERLVFRVDRICDVIKDRIFSLFESNIFVWPLLTSPTYLMIQLFCALAETKVVRQWLLSLVLL